MFADFKGETATSLLFSELWWLKFKPGTLFQLLEVNLFRKPAVRQLACPHQGSIKNMLVFMRVCLYVELLSIHGS